MDSIRLGVLIVAAMLCFVRSIDAVALSGDCSADATSCDTGLVCETSDDTCRVKADGAATGCGTDDAKCPTNAKCYADVCKCSIGYKVSADLCVDATCTADSDCTSSITNSMCEKVSPCSKGTCTCKSGYSGSDCESLGYGKSCTSGSGDKCDPSLNLECPSGGTTCDCTSGNSYKSAFGLCTNKKIIGEDCTNDGDCYSVTSAECDTTCKCPSGYYQDGQVCRRPYGGEDCTDTCIVVPTTSLLTGESSQQAPTCATNKKCDCGSNEKVSRKIGDTCYTVCLSTGGNTKAVGETCSNFNDCASKVCAKCPDDADAKCYNAPCSGSTFSGSILVCSIILFSIFI